MLFVLHLVMLSICLIILFVLYLVMLLFCLSALDVVRFAIFILTSSGFDRLHISLSLASRHDVASIVFCDLAFAFSFISVFMISSLFVGIWVLKQFWGVVV